MRNLLPTICGSFTGVGKNYSHAYFQASDISSITSQALFFYFMPGQDPLASGAAQRNAFTYTSTTVYFYNDADVTAANTFDVVSTPDQLRCRDAAYLRASSHASSYPAFPRQLSPLVRPKVVRFIIANNRMRSGCCPTTLNAQASTFIFSITSIAANWTVGNFPGIANPARMGIGSFSTVARDTLLYALARNICADLSMSNLTLTQMGTTAYVTRAGTVTDFSLWGTNGTSYSAGVTPPFYGGFFDFQTANPQPPTTIFQHWVEEYYKPGEPTYASLYGPTLPPWGWLPADQLLEGFIPYNCFDQEAFGQRDQADFLRWLVIPSTPYPTTGTSVGVGQYATADVLNIVLFCNKNILGSFYTGPESFLTFARSGASGRAYGLCSPDSRDYRRASAVAEVSKWFTEAQTGFGSSKTWVFYDTSDVLPGETDLHVEQLTSSAHTLLSNVDTSLLLVGNGISSDFLAPITLGTPTWASQKVWEPAQLATLCGSMLSFGVTFVGNFDSTTASSYFSTMIRSYFGLA